MRRPEKTECCERLRHLSASGRGLAAPSERPVLWARTPGRPDYVPPVMTAVRGSGRPAGRTGGPDPPTAGPVATGRARSVETGHGRISDCAREAASRAPRCGGRPAD